MHSLILGAISVFLYFLQGIRQIPATQTS